MAVKSWFKVSTSQCVRWLSLSVLLFWILSAPELHAFEGEFDIIVGNNTDGPIRLLLPNTRRHTSDLKKGEFGRLRFPSSDGREQGLLEVQVANCSYRYSMNSSFVTDYPWKMRGAIVFQLENDFFLYAVPPDTTATLSKDALSPLQTPRFPLRPVDKSC